MAAALIAVGLFISSLTDSQIVAAVISIAVSVMLFSLDGFLSGINAQWIVTALQWVSFQGRYYTFIEGLFDIANAVCRCNAKGKKGDDPDLFSGQTSCVEGQREEKGQQCENTRCGKKKF